MKRFQLAFVAAIGVAAVQCSNANAPESAQPPGVGHVDTTHHQGDTPEIVSPSGRIAFVTEDSPGNGSLYIANSDGSGLRRLIGGSFYYSRPRWSPDRRRIAFGVGSLGSTIFVIDVDGQSGILQLAEGFDPAWSPDGKQIVFASQGGIPDGGSGIYVMNADGTGIRQLTPPKNPTNCAVGVIESDRRPDWSPDGTKILFERVITTDQEGDFGCGLFSYGDIPNVYVMNVDGTGVRRLRDVAPIVTDASPAWSPDGRLVAYNSYSGGIFLIDSAGASVAQPVPTQINGGAFDPVWSADGKKLLFLDADPPNNRVAIYDLATGITTRLIFPTVTGLTADVAWSR